MRTSTRLRLFVCAALLLSPLNAVAQDASKLRIAGLSLGAVAVDLPRALAKHGFAPVAPLADSANLTRKNPGANRRVGFRRSDGHTLDISVQPDGAPVVQSLIYGMATDRDSYEQLRRHLRGLFGPPQVVHGAETGVRVAVWEIAGTDITIDGVLTTSVTLIRNPAEGHSLTVQAVRIRADFGGGAPAVSGNRGVSSSY